MPAEGAHAPQCEREKQCATGFGDGGDQHVRRRDILRTASAPIGCWPDRLGANPHRSKGAGLQCLAMGRQRERRGSDETTGTALVTNTDDPVKSVGSDAIKIAPWTARPRVLKYPRDVRPGNVTSGEQGFIGGRDIESDAKNITNNCTQRVDSHFDGKEIGRGIVDHDVLEDGGGRIMDEIREGEGRGGA